MKLLKHSVDLLSTVDSAVENIGFTGIIRDQYSGNKILNSYYHSGTNIFDKNELSKDYTFGKQTNR